MANQSISQLTSATTPLTGSEQVPLVQSSQTKKATTFDIASTIGSPIFQPDIIYYAGSTAGGIAIDMQDYSPYNFWARQILAPNLVTMYGTIFMYSDNNSGEPILTTISMPLLQTIGTLTNEPTTNSIYGIYIQNWLRLQTINFSSLTTIELNGADTFSESIAISSCDSLTTLNIGSLTSIDYNFYVNSCPLLTTFSIANLTTFDGNFDASTNALNQATIDAILYQLAVVVNLQNKIVDLAGGTNAAPSVTGATYVAILTGNGCTVTTN
jgi:hypothetical protein